MPMPAKPGNQKRFRPKSPRREPREIEFALFMRWRGSPRKQKDRAQVLGLHAMVRKAYPPKKDERCA